MNKKILILIIAVLATISSFSQQLPLYSQYMMNGFLLNPAMAGNVDYIPLRLTARQQWMGIDNAPSTQAISGHYLFSNKKMGLGGYIYNDMVGPISQTGIKGAYSYHLPIGSENKLAFGLAISAFQFKFDESKAEIVDESDPVINYNVQSTFVPDADFGVYFFNDENRYYAGLAATQILQLPIELDKSNKNSIIRHYFLMGGYKFNINDEMDIEPSLLAKGTESTPFNIDVNIKGYYKKNYWLGFSYRSDNSFVAMLGLKVNSIVFGVAYDYPFSSINNYSSGTPEIMIGYNIGEGQSGSSLL